MKLLDKLGMSMEDVKQAQKKAAAEKNSGRSAQGAASGTDSKKTVGGRTGNTGKTIQVRNTGTAMGRALAQAMGGIVLEDSGAKGGKTGSMAGSPTAKEGASAKTETAGSIEKRIGDKKKLALELGIGEITLTDIMKELEKPARDPRESMPAPILRSDVLDMKDLKPGMVLKGTVRNVIDFGVFVDIGVHQDGLVHISQITDKFIKHPLEAVSVGDVVEVQVLSVDMAKKRIGLTMKIGKDAK